MKTFAKYQTNLKYDSNFIYSYKTKVAQIIGDQYKLLEWNVGGRKTSPTTTKHINYAVSELCLQPYTESKYYVYFKHIKKDGTKIDTKVKRGEDIFKVVSANNVEQAMQVFQAENPLLEMCGVHKGYENECIIQIK